jgi:hypothetical protein
MVRNLPGSQGCQWTPTPSGPRATGGTERITREGPDQIQKWRPTANGREASASGPGLRSPDKWAIPESSANGTTPWAQR